MLIYRERGFWGFCSLLRLSLCGFEANGPQSLAPEQCQPIPAHVDHVDHVDPYLTYGHV